MLELFALKEKLLTSGEHKISFAVDTLHRFVEEFHTLSPVPESRTLIWAPGKGKEGE
ncbi:MAG: hypothetical protein WBP71_08815 [Terracidiphilus sp.]